MSEFPFRIIKNTKNTTTVGKTSLSLVAHSNPCVILHCSVRDFVNGSFQATYLEEERENR